LPLFKFQPSYEGDKVIVNEDHTLEFLIVLFAIWMLPHPELVQPIDS